MKSGCKKLPDSPSPAQSTATLPFPKGRPPALHRFPRQMCKLAPEARRPAWQRSLKATAGSRTGSRARECRARSWRALPSPACNRRFKKNRTVACDCWKTGKPRKQNYKTHQNETNTQFTGQIPPLTSQTNTQAVN